MPTRKSSNSQSTKPESKAAAGAPSLNMSMAEIKTELIKLVQEKSLFDGDMVLPSGKIATQYLYLSETLLSARGSFLASMAILYHLREDIRFVGGAFNRANALASAVSSLAQIRGQELDTFLVLDDSSTRRYGHSKFIQGPLKPGADVCIVQDEVVDGIKVIETIRRLQEEADARIIQVIAIFDRLDGAKLRLENYGVDYTAILTMKDISQEELSARR